MKVIAIPIVFDALGTVSKKLEKRLHELEISGRIKTIQTTAVIKPARILRRVLGLEEICCHSDTSQKPSVRVGVKKNSRNKIILRF